MRTISLFIILISLCTMLQAKSPDSTAVTKLYNTSWTMTKKYRFGRGAFHLKHKVETPDESFITIYKDEIQTNLVGGELLVCASRHRNQNEFWLDCVTQDQYIFKVIKCNSEELVLDILMRLPQSTKYVRTSRCYYKRKRN